ncbi:putative protein dehydration-induced 19 [Helianthus debilis subsp. tardiflorus]
MGWKMNCFFQLNLCIYFRDMGQQVSNSNSQFLYHSFDPSLSSEEREKRLRQATGRAVFLQDLLVSTLLAD